MWRGNASSGLFCPTDQHQGLHWKLVISWEMHAWSWGCFILCTSVDSLVPYVSKTIFLLNWCPENFFLSFFFHSLYYGLFLQAMSGYVFWIEFRVWEMNQLCWLVKSLLFSLLVSSPCYRGLKMHYKHMYCVWMNEAGQAAIQQWLCLNAILTLTTSLQCCNRAVSCWQSATTFKKNECGFNSLGIYSSYQPSVARCQGFLWQYPS